MSGLCVLLESLDSVLAARKNVNESGLPEQESQILLAVYKNVESELKEAQRNTSRAHEGQINTCTAIGWYASVFFVLTFAQWHGLIAPVDKNLEQEYCWDLSTMVGLVWATVRVWIAAKVSKHKILPALFPQTHNVMAMDRRLKAIGNIVKATARLGCTITTACARHSDCVSLSCV